MTRKTTTSISKANIKISINKAKSPFRNINNLNKTRNKKGKTPTKI